jgi:hypothetical protein
LNYGKILIGFLCSSIATKVNSPLMAIDEHKNPIKILP